MNKIKSLIEAGEKATQGEWSHDWIYSVLRYASKSGFEPQIECVLERCNYYGGDPAFITAAANARAEIKALYEAAEDMAAALEGIKDLWDCDCPEDDANDPIGWNGDGELPTKFKDVRRCPQALERYNKLKGN